MADKQKIVQVPGQQQKVIRDFTLPNASGAQTSFVRSTINTNFKIKASLIQMVQ